MANPYRREGLDLLTDDRHARRDLEDVPETAATRKDEARKDRILTEALERFPIAAEADQEQRKRELEDLKFDRALPEDQWDQGILTARAGGLKGGRLVAARPCLTIPKLDQPIQQVINEARQARLAIVVKPKGDGANNAGAELRQGLIRAIEVDSRAHIARLWALERAAKCGRGAYRILKTYANDGDFDQDAVVASIPNQGGVYWDPFAAEPDGSDAKYVFITSDLPIDVYKREYPHSKAATVDGDDLPNFGNRAPDWIDQQHVRIAEYFYLTYEARELVHLRGQGTFWAEGDTSANGIPVLPPGLEVPAGAKRRVVQIPSVKWCVINAGEILQEEDWEGRYIPVIRVVGKRYNVDGKWCYKGIVSNAKDAQRSYNYMRSAQVEAIGLAPKAPWVVAEGQIAGYEQQWAQANTSNFPYLVYKPTDYNGNLLPPPQRNTVEPAIQAITLGVREADGDIKATTGRFDASLGNLSQRERSGKAIKELKQQGESTTSVYLENLATISMTYEGRILIDLMPYIYDRPGRIVRLLGDEPKDEQRVMLNQPFVQGENGMPQAAPPPGMGGMLRQIGSMLPGGKSPAKPKTYELKPGDDYTVVVSVGRAVQTQREENTAVMQTILQAAPGLTPMLADLWMDQLDGPMAKQAAERLRKMNPQLQDEEDAPQVPPQMQQQMQQQGQQIQQLTQALQATTQELKTQQGAKQQQLQADVMMKREELASREKIAQMQIEADVLKAKAQFEAKSAVSQLEAYADRIAQAQKERHEQTMQGLKAQDAERVAVRDAALERVATAQDAAFEIPPPTEFIPPEQPFA